MYKNYDGYSTLLQTHYRQKELRIWSGLKHNNVTALCGVVLVPLPTYRGQLIVYQLMQLMTSMSVD